MASYLHRTAQPSTLATFRSWGSSTGAGRIRLAEANIRHLTSEAAIYAVEFLRSFFMLYPIPAFGLDLA